MCGIAGFLNLSRSDFRVQKPLLDKMQKAMRHRGPDGFGHWISKDNQLGLTHRRLSIVDLSSKGAQPMTDRSGRLVISYNGEVYNAPALRAELGKLGYRHFSRTDTESILYAYDRWGIEALRRLEGMFAFCLHDAAKNETYLVRDRMGVKPVYFTLQGGIFSFASEMNVLWELPWVEKKTNPRGLYHYLTFRVTPAPLTLFDGVYKLPAGFYTKIDAQRRVSFHRWYDPLAPETRYERSDLADEGFCIEHIRELMRRSVKQQLISDVPYGAFLSGGVDSSLVTALMSEYSRKVKTFNVTWSDSPELSEADWAREVSRVFKTDHHEVSVGEKQALDLYERLTPRLDEPLSGGVNVQLYFVSKLLKDSGATVALTGEGSDELFCGYPEYGNYMARNPYWSASIRMVPSLLRKMLGVAGRVSWRNDPSRLESLNDWSEGHHLFWSGAIAFPEMWKRSLWKFKESFSEDPILEQIHPGFDQARNSYVVVDYHLKQMKRLDPSGDFLKSIGYLEFKHRLPEHLLTRVDKMAMAASVEARVPFLDHHLVEFVFQMPSRFKYRRGTTKYILKKACEGILPHDVIYRPKVGFSAPTAKWFRKGRHFRPYFQGLLADNRRKLKRFFDVSAVDKMLALQKGGDCDFSTELWLLQNVMAQGVLG